jgi:hypothetical protein
MGRVRFLCVRTGSHYTFNHFVPSTFDATAAAATLSSESAPLFAKDNKNAQMTWPPQAKSSRMSRMTRTRSQLGDTDRCSSSSNQLMNLARFGTLLLVHTSSFNVPLLPLTFVEQIVTSFPNISPPASRYYHALPATLLDSRLHIT